MRMAVPVTCWMSLPEIVKFVRVRDDGFPPPLDTAIPCVPMRADADSPWIVLAVIATTSVPLPGTPAVPPGPLASVLATATWMPAALGKFVMMLLSIVAFVRVREADDDPTPTKLIPKPSEAAALV